MQLTSRCLSLFPVRIFLLFASTRGQGLSSARSFIAGLASDRSIVFSPNRISFISFFFFAVRLLRFCYGARESFLSFFYFQRNLALGSGISRLSVLKDSGKQPLEHQCLSKEENNLFFVFYYARYVLPSFSKNIGQSI